MYQNGIFWYIFEKLKFWSSKIYFKENSAGDWTVIGIILIDKISLWPILDIPFVLKTFQTKYFSLCSFKNICYIILGEFNGVNWVKMG